MEIETIQVANRAANPAPDAEINYQIEFSTLKRQLLIFLAPVVIAVGVALGVSRLFLFGLGAILGLVGFVLIIFGLWMPFHAIFGYAEVWRFEKDAITRVRRNPLWKGEKSWDYSVVKGVRIKETSNRIQPQLLIRGKGWLPLPEQADRDTAERLKTLIGNFKRATMPGAQA